jgi:hypothetical protein
MDVIYAAEKTSIAEAVHSVRTVSGGRDRIGNRATSKPT